MKNIAAVLLAGVMLTSFTACGPEDQNSGYIAAGVTNMGEFDWDQTMRNIKFYGKEVNMPCTISELGDGFTTSGGKQYDGFSMFNLKYNDELVGSVRLFCDAGADTSSQRIDYIEVLPQCKFDINGLSFDSNINDVEKRFGEPNSKERAVLRYNGSSEKYVEFYKAGANNIKIEYIAIQF